MKQICFLAILTLLFSGCKKETTHFLVGKWAIKEAWNDIGGGPVSNPTNSFIEFKDKTWQAVIVEGKTSMLKGVTRLAANRDNTKLAVVVSE